MCTQAIDRRGQMASNESSRSKEISAYRFEPEFDDDEIATLPSGSVDGEGEGGGSRSLERSGSSPELEETRVGHCRWCKCDCCVPMTRAEDSLCGDEDDAASAKRELLQCIC